MKLRFATILTCALLLCVVAGAFSRRSGGPSDQPQPAVTDRDDSVRSAVARVDQVFREAWKAAGVEPLPAAEPFVVARRLSLALCGTIPSLEEIRAMEAMPADQRIDAHLERLITDRRFADYVAERLARAFVGTDDGPFLLFRRRRFVYWLSDELAGNRPYNELAREIISAEGLWTDHPATNFVTARILENQGPDPLALAARTTRAFLGVRIDCAQCHDHPFAEWKQTDFEGLAAYFAQTKQSFRGIEDKTGELKVEDVKTKAEREVSPRVPFNESDIASAGRRREQLAAWITSDSNPYFAKAIANRVWTLMFGSGLIEPVDDLEAEPRVEGVLDVLADDFRSHGYDVRRLVRVIAATAAFRAAASGDSEVTEQQEKHFAAFPLVRLRSEQIAGSLVQVASLRTVDAESHVFIRFLRLVTTADFINRYGDAGEEELNAHIGTIPQRLVMLNGKMPRERIQAGPMSAAGRITSLSPSDATRVRTAYLVCLTRPPTDEELDHFVARLKDLKGDDRKHAVEDMMWSLINSTEFSWNH
jgi:hypothetical protein